MGPTLLHDFEAKAASDPDFPMVEQGDRVWRRRDLVRLADAFEGHVPVHPEGSLVALRAKNGPSLLACLVLARRRGWTIMLLDGETRDRQMTEALRAFALDGALDVVDPCPPSSGAPAAAVQWIDPTATGAKTARPGLSWPPETAAPPAFVKLTSGSTGRPNAVVVSEAQVLSDESALFSTMGLGSERVLTAIPLAHSYGFSSVAIAALRRDFTLVLPENSNPLSAIRCLSHRAVTFLPSVPAWLKALTELPAAPEGLGGVGTVISAGAPLPPAVAVAFRQRFGLPIHNFYGASECGGICYDRDGEAGLTGSLGHPVDGVEIELVDAGEADGSSASSGAEGVGRVCVRSGAVALGRLAPHDPTGAQPHRTVVVDDSLGHGRFLTMDLGRLEVSGLRILGRADDLLNLRGRKVHPREIETVLDSHPSVRESYVFQTDSAASDVLVAVIVGADQTSRSDLLDWARSRLPDYKVPRVVVQLPGLARNARGKLDRRTLEQQALDALRRNRTSSDRKRATE